MADAGFLAGIALDAEYVEDEKGLLIAVTERRTRAEIDAYVTALAKAVAWSSAAPGRKADSAPLLGRAEPDPLRALPSGTQGMVAAYHRRARGSAGGPGARGPSPKGAGGPGRGVRA